VDSVGDQTPDALFESAPATNEASLDVYGDGDNLRRNNADVVDHNHGADGMTETADLILNDFRSLINEYGAVTPTGHASQNDILFTAIYVIALVENLGEVPAEEAHRLRSSITEFLGADGHTKRTPVSNELESVDNLLAWGLLAAVLRPEWAAGILNFARLNGWTWPSANPKHSQLTRWLGRFRGAEAHLQLAAGEDPDLITQFWWIASGIYSLFQPKHNQDNYNLSYVMAWTVKYLQKRGKPVPVAMKLGAAIRTIVWEQIRGVSLGANLKNYGWRGTAYNRWIP
jgi:hypothetical protein